MLTEPWAAAMARATESSPTPSDMAEARCDLYPGWKTRSHSSAERASAPTGFRLETDTCAMPSCKPAVMRMPVFGRLYFKALDMT
jgi:hypothetical protein